MYDKDKIKDQLTLDMIIELVRDFGGDPKITNFGFISATICHNHPGEGSHKLYYYENTKLFRCYTGCDSTFDIFELCCKVHELNTMKPWSLVDAMNYVVKRFGFSGGSSDSPEDFGGLLDVPIFQKYEHLLEPKADTSVEQLKEYDTTILKRLSYPVIKTWLDEGISKEVMRQNLIGYYPPTEQITIPHFDKDGRFIGLRGRFLGKQDAELYGKYRPMIINGIMYNHALGLNLYNFNNSRKNIQNIKKAIIVEGEKSCLLYQSYFGAENDISVACCGSSISSYQMQLLIDDGVEEVIIAFDKQFQEKGDNEFKHLVKNLKSIKQKYGNYVNVSFIFDKTDLLGYKDSPLDRGKEKFIELFKSRVIL
jgi:hypothetical protein